MNGWVTTRSLMVVALLFAVATGCGGVNHGSLDSIDSPHILPEISTSESDVAQGTAPGLDELKAALEAEFDRLGINQDKVTATAPSGIINGVFDLEVTSPEPDRLALKWTERVVGDYNQDGVVNISDLTPLGQRWNQEVIYRQPPPNGIPYWPQGEPDDGSFGSENWRDARIDGNYDGLVSINDVTQIGQHWQERLDGYIVEYKGPGETDFSPLGNPDDPLSLVSIHRSTTFPEGESAPDNQLPVRYEFWLENRISELAEGEHLYRVIPYDATADEEGPESNEASIGIGPPTAAITAYPAEGTAPLDVVLDANGSKDWDGTIDTYEWDFEGDGVYDTLPLPDDDIEHTYDVPGDYHPTVRVTDNNGLQDTASATVAVTKPGEVVAVLAASPDPPEATEPPLTVSFDASGSYDPTEGTNAGDGISDYEWDFDGDGEYNETGAEAGARGNPTPPGHEYTAYGRYDAAVRVTGTSPERQKTAIKEVVVGTPPVAVLSVDISSGNQPLEVTFDGSASYDTNGSIVKYVWDWDGDGVYDEDTGAVSIVQHIYEDPDTYNANLKVEDNDGLIDTDSQQITVSNTPPVAELTIGTGEEYGEPAHTVHFDASDSTDVDGTIAQYDFDWEGDGTYDVIDGDPQQVYEYTVSGDYSATVKVFDNDGAEDTDTVSITVNLPPTAALDANPLSGEPPLTVSFDASDSADSDGTIDQYDYDWTSDGTYDLLDGGPTPSHEYTASGDYIATVRVTDDDGATDTAQSVLIVVNIPPTADLQADPTSGFGSLTVDFDANGSTDADGTIEQYDYDWEGDGTYDLIDGGAAPSHMYSTGGTYDATVRVTDDNGGTDTASVQVEVLGWNHTWGGSGEERLTAVVEDNSGSIYVTGWTSTYGAGDQDVLLLKYNSAGVLQW